MGFPDFLGGPGNGRFQDMFKCYSMVFFNNPKGEAEHGGKSNIKKKFVLFII